MHEGLVMEFRRVSIREGVSLHGHAGVEGNRGRQLSDPVQGVRNKTSDHTCAALVLTLWSCLLGCRRVQQGQAAVGC